MKKYLDYKFYQKNLNKPTIMGLVIECKICNSYSMARNEPCECCGDDTPASEFCENCEKILDALQLLDNIGNALVKKAVNFRISKKNFGDVTSILEAADRFSW